MKGLVIILLMCALLAANASAGSPASDSIYLLNAPLTTQDGDTAHLDVFHGHPVLISMFYASCPHVCPTLIAAIRAMELRLPEDHRKQLRVILVSVDPERDTPEILSALAKRHQVNLTRWRFVRLPKTQVRKLAAVLGIQYRQLPDGEFNHSTVITLLDEKGRMVAQTRSITRPDTEFRNTLLKATATE